MSNPILYNELKASGHVELDLNMIGLAKALNRLPGVTTFSSCGGHLYPDSELAQCPEGTFYIQFDIKRSNRGRDILELLSWASNEAQGSDTFELLSWTFYETQNWDILELLSWAFYEAQNRGAKLSFYPYPLDPAEHRGDDLTFYLAGQEDPDHIADYLRDVIIFKQKS
jgi:hypothetical protein